MKILGPFRPGVDQKSQARARPVLKCEIWGPGPARPVLKPGPVPILHTPWIQSVHSKTVKYSTSKHLGLNLDHDWTSKPFTIALER